MWKRFLLRGPRPVLIDAALLALVFAALYAIIHLGEGTAVLFTPSRPMTELSPWMLPYYAGRSILRMFIALLLSLLVTFVYAKAAVRTRLGEGLLMPLVDILQSVPVLGFLSVTITFFIGLFPHSLLGVECASIFAVFTGQVWNMILGFYQSLMAPYGKRNRAGTKGDLSGSSLEKSTADGENCVGASIQAKQPYVARILPSGA